MFQIIETPLGSLDLYDLMAIFGAVISVLAQMVLLYRWTGKWRSILFSALYGLYSWVGGYGSSIVRVLSYDDGGKTDGFWKSVAGDYGKHYLGTVLVIAILAVPATAMLYRLMFRKGKECNRYILYVTNALAVGILVQHICGRFGCFARGCCFGMPYQGFLSITFPYGQVSYSVFPTQLFEILCTSLLLLLISILIVKKKAVFGVTLMGFSVIIFLSEFLMDQRGTRLFYNLTVIQWFAMLLCLFGIALTIWLQRMKRLAEQRAE